MNDSFVLNVKFIDVYIIIYNKSLNEKQKLHNKLELNSYIFDNIHNKEKEADYVVQMCDVDQLDFNLSSLNKNILLHETTQINEEDYELKGKYADLGNERYIYNPKLDTYISFCKSNGFVKVFGNESNRIIQVLDLLREQLIQKKIEYMGYAYLKGAAFSYNSNDDVCVLIGEKKSGKTTSLLKLMTMYPEYKYVCNSAAYIKVVNNELNLFSWRPHMRIRKGTALYYGFFKQEENCLEKTEIDSDFIKIKTYSEIQDYFSNEILLSGKVNKVIVLEQRDDMEEGIELTKLDKNDDMEIIFNNIRVGRDLAHPNFLSLDENESANNEKIKIELLDFIKENLRVYSLKINPNKVKKWSEMIGRVLGDVGFLE